MLMKVVAAAIKDKNSLIKSKFSKRDPFRNYDLEAAIIKATSHDEYVIDRSSAQMVFSWVRASPISLRPFVWALSKRIEKTRSWIVALKGLILMHGVIHCNVPEVHNMGRLPFDLSSFSDRDSKSCKTWGFNSFVRNYFEFLDERATVSFDQDDKKSQQGHSSMMQRLLKIKKWQSLLYTSLKVRPMAHNMRDVGLIIEAMNCVAFEIFDIYGRICGEIVEVLFEIHSIDKLEAELALKILQNATKHADDISLFLKFHRELHADTAAELPTVVQILEEDVQQKLVRIINGDSDKTRKDVGCIEVDEKMAAFSTEENHVDGAIVGQRESVRGDLKTIITDEWVVFDDEHLAIENVDEETAAKDLDLISINPLPLCYNHHYEVPDLITF